MADLTRRLIGRLRRTLPPVPYDVAKVCGLLKLRLEASRRRGVRPLLVYTMGKVGTTTIARSLDKCLNNVPVYHLHTLSEHRLKEIDAVYRTRYSEIQTIYDHLLNGLFLRKRILQGCRGGLRPRVITMTREPVARNISEFFQSLHLTPRGREFESRLRSGGDKSLTQEMTEFFIAEFDHGIRCEWFDEEIKEHLGIDVLGQEFPIEKGLRVYQSERADLLLIRLESLAECGTEPLQQFLEVEEFQLEYGQASSRKFYADVYRDFRDTIVLPDDLLDLYYKSRLATTFYSPEEIASFRLKWGRKETAP